MAGVRIPETSEISTLSQHDPGLHGNRLSYIWTPSPGYYELLAPVTRTQIKMEVRVWGKRLIGNSGLLSQEEKKNRRRGG